MMPKPVTSIWENQVESGICHYQQFHVIEK